MNLLNISTRKLFVTNGFNFERFKLIINFDLSILALYQAH